VELTSDSSSRLRQEGFSLIEVLFAMLLLAMAILSVLAALDHGMRLNASSRDYTAVSNIAKTHLESLVARPFTSAALTPGAHTVAESGYDVSYTVTEFDIDAGNPDPATSLQTPVGAGTGEVKVIRLTVTAQRVNTPGRRTITVEAVKHIR